MTTKEGVEFHPTELSVMTGMFRICGAHHGSDQPRENY